MLKSLGLYLGKFLAGISFVLMRFQAVSAQYLLNPSLVPQHSTVLAPPSVKLKEC